jgi:predicted dehydrogenase
MRFGIIGTGDAGGSFAGAAHHAPGVELVGVAGRTPEKVAALAVKMQTHAFTPDTLIAAKPDCIAIATPPGVHAAQAIACLKAGIHVMVEKPMALCTEDCDAIIAAAAPKGLKVMVTQTWRYRDITRKARELVASGRFGAVTCVAIRASHNYFGGKRTGWHLEVDLAGGGVTLNPFIHMIDLARYLAGDEVVDVQGHVGCRKKGYAIDSDTVCLARFSRGATALVHVDGNGVSLEDAIDIFLTDGLLRVRPTEKRIEVVIANRVAEVFGFGENGTTNAKGIYGFGGYVNHVIEMRDAIEKGGPITSDGANGRENVRIARALLERAGLPLAKPTV